MNSHIVNALKKSYSCTQTMLIKVQSINFVALNQYTQHDT